MNKVYYIHGITFSGMMFDSDRIDNASEVEVEREKFDSMLSYFGGGFCTLVTLGPAVNEYTFETEKIL